MARPTQQEIDEFNARMSEPEDNADDDDMVIIELPDGRKVHRKYSKVKDYLKKNGLDFDDVEIEEDPNPGEDPLKDNPEPPARTSAKYFGKTKLWR